MLMGASPLQSRSRRSCRSRAAGLPFLKILLHAHAHTKSQMAHCVVSDVESHLPLQSKFVQTAVGLSHMITTPNHALQRTRPSVVVCNHGVPWAGSLSFCR